MTRNRFKFAPLLLAMICLFLPGGCRKSPEALNAQLLSAVKSWEIADAKSAIQAGASVNAIVPSDRNPALQMPILIYAIDRGNFGCAELLLDRGADVNARASDGMTALAVTIASEGKITPFLQKLLDKNPQLNFPLDLRPNQQNPDALFNASAFSVDLVNEFLRRGALVNAPDRNGWTALHLAAKFNNAPVMQALIAAGADVTLKNNDGQTADDLLRANSQFGPGQGIQSLRGLR